MFPFLSNIASVVQEGVLKTEEISEEAKRRQDEHKSFLKREKTFEQLIKERDERIQELKQQIDEARNSIKRIGEGESVEDMQVELSQLQGCLRASLFEAGTSDGFHFQTDSAPGCLEQSHDANAFQLPVLVVLPKDGDSQSKGHCVLVTEEELSQWAPIETPVAGRAYKTVSRIGGANSMHCGIYIGNSEWIHINGGKVRRTTGIRSFASGGIYEHSANSVTRFSPELVVIRAEKALEFQETGSYVWRYLPTLSNCEHFTMLIMTGEFRSLQVESWDLKRRLAAEVGNGLLAAGSVAWRTANSGRIFDASVADSLPVGLCRKPEETQGKAKPQLPPGTKLNREGKICKLGRSGKYYCGKQFQPKGKCRICGHCEDGKCGPNTGCQCSACSDVR
ncbi:MAG: hypothetical protein I8H75_05015 [Myxococcaceae bacterium]|nr:hypothetical protein [Myxococcaceae bacterium]